jgi:hypothetical protein
VSGWLLSLRAGRMHAAATVPPPYLAASRGGWRHGDHDMGIAATASHDGETRVPTSPTAGRRPAGGDLRDENNGANAPGPADHACSVLPLALRGQGRPHPWPHPLLPAVPFVSGANFHIACLHTANPPSHGPVCRQSRSETRQAVRVRRFPVPPRRNRRDDAGQARCPVHRACCLFLSPRSLPRLPTLSPSGVIRLHQAPCGTACRRSPCRPAFVSGRHAVRRWRYGSGALVSFCIQ